MRPACAPLSVDPAQPKVALNALRGDEPLPLHAFMLDTKRHAVAHLAKALGGDMLAAEYALLVLLSRVYARTEVSDLKRKVGEFLLLFVAPRR